MQEKITIADIATKANVSTATVSRVLNHSGSVKKELYQKVMNAVKELDYNYIKNKGNKSDIDKKVIALIVPDILNPFFPSITYGIESVAKTHGYNLIICNFEEDIRLEQQLIEQLIKINVAGIIYVPSEEENPQIVELLEDNYPFVFLDRIIDRQDLNYVISDNIKGAYQATKYLLDLGHKDIIYISGPKKLSTEQHRYAGFKKALEDYNLDINTNLVIEGDYHFDKAYQNVLYVIEKRQQFTAIFASNDQMAFGALKAINEKGIKVPDEISIIGYDDIPFSSTIELTTVSQSSFEMGKNAVQLLFGLINNTIQQPKQIVLNPSIIIRNTCSRV